MDYQLKSSNMIPKFGLGTWCIGEKEKKKKREIEAIVYALENGIRLIDTAEMYGNGTAEILVGEALKQSNIKREDLFIISKVYPHNAGKASLFKSLKSSLSRLGLEYLDMYLLHWRGRIPLSETVECMEEAKKEGLIKDWGVSNFDVEDMKELETVKDGDKCSLDQVLYYLGSRGIDFDLVPYLNERNISLMTYSPLGRAGELSKNIFKSESVIQIAEKHNITAAQVALAFIMNLNDNRIPIPKSSSKKHILENIKSQDIKLDNEDMDLLNREFPKPDKKLPLDII